MTRVPVSPKMLRWACERAGYDVVHVRSAHTAAHGRGSDAKGSQH